MVITERLTDWQQWSPVKLWNKQEPDRIMTVVFKYFESDGKLNKTSHPQYELSVVWDSISRRLRPISGVEWFPSFLPAHWLSPFCSSSKEWSEEQAKNGQLFEISYHAICGPFPAWDDFHLFSRHFESSLQFLKRVIRRTSKEMACNVITTTAHRGISDCAGKWNGLITHVHKLGGKGLFEYRLSVTIAIKTHNTPSNELMSLI